METTRYFIGSDNQLNMTEVLLFGAHCWPGDLPSLALVCRSWPEALARDVLDLYFFIRACQCYETLTRQLDDGVYGIGRMPLRRALLCTLCLSSTQHKSQNFDFSERLKRYAIDELALPRRHMKTTSLAEATAIYLVALEKDAVVVQCIGKRARNKLKTMIEEYIVALGCSKNFTLESTASPEESSCDGTLTFSSRFLDERSQALKNDMGTINLRNRLEYVYF